MKTRIVTITDCQDIASHEVRATILSSLDRLNSSENIVVEPFAYCKEFSVINCAFVVRLLAESYSPEKTVFLVIANALPTSRQDRARLVGRTKNGFRFVGENTGALSWLIADFGVSEVYEFSSEGLDGENFVSFGGKYFHAPEAARVASSNKLDCAGQSFGQSRLSMIDLSEGTIVHVDNFGVAKIKVSLPDVKEGSLVPVLVDGKHVFDGIFTYSMKNLPDNTWAIYRGSSMGLTEIGCVRKIHHNNNPLHIGSKICFRRS